MRINGLLERIQGEFLDMPGLRLSVGQGQRLWGLDHDVCDALLNALVDAGILTKSADGLYALRESSTPMRLSA